MELTFPSNDWIASQALLAGTKPAEIMDLLDNIDRWRELGLIRKWTDEQVRKRD